MTNMEVRREVERMLEDGVPFGLVEDYIEEHAHGSDAKSALWLLAWAKTDDDARSAVIDSILL